MHTISGSRDLYLGGDKPSKNKVPFDRLYDSCQCGEMKRKEHDLCQSCGARRGILRRRARAVFRKILEQKKRVKFQLPPDIVVGNIPPYHDDVWWEDRLLMLNLLERG